MPLGKFDELIAAYQTGFQRPTDILQNAGNIAKAAQPTQKTTGYGEEGVSDLTRQYLDAPEKAPEPTKLGGQSGDIAAGFKSNVEGLKGLYYGVKSLASHAMGDDEGFKESTEKFKESEKRSQEITAGKVAVLEDIKWGEDGYVGRTFDYLQHQLGAAVPSILTSVASGLVGAALGGAAGNLPGAIVGGVGGAFGKNFVQDQIKKRVTGIVDNAVKSGIKRELAEATAKSIAEKQVAKQIGATAGMLASGYAMGLGDIYNETRDENERGAILTSFLGAVPYAALDAVTEIGILGKLGKANDGAHALTRYAKEITATGAKEGATESAQEALLMAAGIANGKEYKADEVISRLGNSFAGGAVAGGFMGGVGAAVGGDPLGNAARDAATQKQIKDTEESTNKALVDYKENRVDQEADGLYKDFPQIRKLYAAGNRIVDEIKRTKNAFESDTGKAIPGYDKKVEAAVADLEKIYKEKDAEGNFVVDSQLEREQARDAVNRLKSAYLTPSMQDEIERQYVKDSAEGIKEVKQVAEEVTKQVTPEQVKKPAKKGKKNEATEQKPALQAQGEQQVQRVPSQQAAPVQEQAKQEEVIPEEAVTDEVVTGDQLVTAPVAEKAPSSPVAAPVAPTPSPTTPPVQQAAVEAPAAPKTVSDLPQPANRLQALKQAVQKVQGTEDPLTVVETAMEQQKPVKLPANKYGGARGTGYKTNKLTVPAKNQIAKAYGENWEQEGSLQKGPNGNYYYVPNDPNKQVTTAEKPKGSKAYKISNVAVDTPFTPTHPKSKDPIFKAGGTTPTTGRLKFDGKQYLMEKEDGSWFAPDEARQRNFKNNKAVQAALPKTATGGVTISEDTIADQAKREDEVGRQIAGEKKAAEQRAAKEAKQIPVPYTKEDLDWLVEKVKEARENQSNGVKDNVKEELQERFGTRSKYKEFENMAMLYVQGIIVPENQQATAADNTNTTVSGTETIVSNKDGSPLDTYNEYDLMELQTSMNGVTYWLSNNKTGLKFSINISPKGKINTQAILSDSETVNKRLSPEDLGKFLGENHISQARLAQERLKNNPDLELEDLESIVFGKAEQPNQQAAVVGDSSPTPTPVGEGQDLGRPLYEQEASKEETPVTLERAIEILDPGKETTASAREVIDARKALKSNGFNTWADAKKAADAKETPFLMMPMESLSIYQKDEDGDYYEYKSKDGILHSIVVNTPQDTAEARLEARAYDQREKDKRAAKKKNPVAAKKAVDTEEGTQQKIAKGMDVDELDTYSMDDFSDINTETNDFMQSEDWEFSYNNFAEDMEAQAKWLESRAVELGYSDLQQLVEQDMNQFAALSGQWRDMNGRPDITAAMTKDYIASKFSTGAEKESFIRRSSVIANDVINVLKEKNPEITFKVFRTNDEVVDYFAKNGGSVNTASGASGLSGYYSPSRKEIGVVLGNHYSVGGIVETLLHETVGHKGMEGLFGDKWDGFVERTWKTNPIIQRKAYDTVGHYLHEKGTPKPSFESLTDRDKYTLIVEYIALQAQRWADPNYVASVDKSTKAFMKRIFAYIKHILRPLVKQYYAVTEEDITQLLAIAYGKSARDSKTLPNDRIFKLAQQWNNSVSRDGVLTLAEGKVQIGDVVYNGPALKRNSPQYQEAFASLEASPEALATAINEPVDNIVQWQRMLNNDAYGTGFFSSFKRFRNNLQKKVDGVLNRYVDAFGDMKSKDLAKSRQRLALGEVDAIQRQSEKLAKIVWDSKKLGATEKGEILAAWEDGRVHRKEFKPVYLSNIQVAALEQLSGMLMKLQKKLVTGNYTNMPDGVKEKIINSYGTYVHQDYLATLDKAYYGRGWLPSSLDWLKKKDISGRQNKIERGAVLDSKYSIINTINLMGHDLAMLEMHKSLINDSNQFGLNWVLTNKTRKVDVNGASYTVQQLDNRISDLNNVINEQVTAGYTNEEVAKAKADLLDITNALEQMEKDIEVGTPSDDEIQNIKNIMWNSGGEYSKLDDNGVPIKGSHKPISPEEAVRFFRENYTFVKGKDIAGPLKYHYVDNRLYKVLVDESKQIHEDANNWAGKMFGLGQSSVLSRATSYWKAHMTVGNLAYWPRAVMGSAFNMDMASDTNAGTLLNYVRNVIMDSFVKPEDATLYAGKHLLDHAVEQGLFSTGYSTSELYAVRDHIQRKGGLEKFKKEFSEGNVKGSLGAMYQIMTNGYHEIFKTLSDYNVNIDGVFKMALMRDYLEIHAKQNRFKSGAVMLNAYQKEDPAKAAAVMRNAAAYAGKGIIEYHDVPGWVKTLRTVPLGGPFLTFNFKMLGIMQRAMIARPQKLIKYYAAAYFATKAMLEASDWDEDDLEEAMKSLPIHMQNKHSIFVLPFKNSDGQVHYADMSYTLPHSFIVDAFLNVADPIPGETRTKAAWDSLTSTTGLFGTPVMTALTVLKTPNHTDPFTGRDLYVPGDTFSNNLRRYGEFAWNMGIPPWAQFDVFNTGTGGGIISDTFNANYKDTFGKDKNPYLTTDLASLSGINFRSYRPEDQKVKNRNYIGFKIRELQTHRSRVLKDVNLSQESRAKQVGDVNRKIKELMQRQKEA